jgi:hypothetical protein
VRGDVAGVIGLPPEDAWLIDPANEKLITPVDERGLVIVSELVRAVKATVDSSYEWPVHLSVHHFYWAAGWYKSAFAGPHATISRELPIHKGLVPRVFENWLHKVTIAPDVPDPDVIDYRVEAWTVAEDLFKSMRQAIRAERRARRIADIAGVNEESAVGLEAMADILHKNFRDIDDHLERLARIPSEFRLVESSDSLATLAARLGPIAMPKLVPLFRAVAA